MQSIFAAALCAALLMAGPARAEGVVKLVVPFAPGGPVDQVARLVAPDLSAELGATVVVKPGGAGGAPSAPTRSPRRRPTARRCWWRRWATSCPPAPRPTCRPAQGPDAAVPVRPGQSLLVVRNSLGVSARRTGETGQVRRAAQLWLQRRGSTMHIGGELFNIAAGIKATHVPYRGAAPALIDLIAGRVDMVNADVPVLQPYVKDGRVKAIVIYDTQRSPYLPDVPSAREAGLPALQMSNWYGALAPAARRRWPRASGWTGFRQVIAKPELARKLADAGSPARWARRISGQAQRRPGPLGAHDPPGRHPHGMTAMTERRRLLMIGPLPPGLRAALAER